METTFHERLVKEKNELEDRHQKLVSFISTDAFRALDMHQKGLLQIQASAMETYLKCLNMRLILLG